MGGWRSVIAIVAAGLLVAGCSDVDPGTTLPDRTTSPTRSESQPASPTPTSSDPTAALEAEIAAFFEEYIATVNESWTSTDALARSREMFADSCLSCLAIYELESRANTENLRYEGEPGRLDDVRLESYANGIAVFSAWTSSMAARLVDPDDVVVQEFSATERLQVIYQARNDGTGWVIIKDDVAS